MNPNDLRRTLVKNKKPLLWSLGVTAVVFVFLGGSFLSLVHNKLELKKLARQTVELDQEYKRLTATLELLKKEDPAYLETLARTRYHMTKPGET